MTSILDSVALQGRKVRLAPVTEDLADRAFELLYGVEDLLRWFIWPGPENCEELRGSYRHWANFSEEGHDYRLAVFEREEDRFVGMIDLRYLGHPRNGSLGYWIGKPYHGRGYMSEAVSLVTWLAFRHLESEALSAWAFVGNDPSRRVLEKNGMRLVRTARGRRYGERVLDEWLFAITRSAYERSDPTPPLIDEVSWRTDRAGL